MPYDVTGSSLENDIIILEKEIAVIEKVQNGQSLTFFDLNILNNIKSDLAGMIRYKKFMLKTHQNRNKESGVKY